MWVNANQKIRTAYDTQIPSYNSGFLIPPRKPTKKISNALRKWVKKHKKKNQRINVNNMIIMMNLMAMMILMTLMMMI